MVNFQFVSQKHSIAFLQTLNSKGAPSGHTLLIREIRVCSGAEFIIVICGSIMTMPGLPSIPAANNIKLNEKVKLKDYFKFTFFYIFQLLSDPRLLHPFTVSGKWYSAS